MSSNLAGSMKEAAFANSPREFDLPASTTLEEIIKKLKNRRRKPDGETKRLEDCQRLDRRTGLIRRKMRQLFLRM